MALRVWLPLTGTLENKGVSDLQFSNTNTSTITVNTAGKIGSCYCRAAAESGGYIISNKTILLNGDISMCCWAKVTATDSGDTANGLITNHSHADSTGFGITVKKISDSDYRISCNTGTGSSRTYYTYYGTTNIKNEWHHLTLTYNNTTHIFQLWVDGKVEKTQSYTNGARDDYIRIFDWSTTYDSARYQPACMLNDVRIYDHCLSAAEVKEISQGLVLHYKLDSFQGGYGNPNIIITHSNAGVDGTGTTGWSAAGTGWTNSFVTAERATGGYAIRCTYSGTSQTSGGIHHPTGIDKTTLTTGDIYTLSARIRTSKACVVTFQNELMTTGHSINATTEWQVYTYTCAIDTSKTYQSNVMYVRAADAVQNMWIECDWIKLEKGTAATPWQPSGVVGTAIQDSSGYGHNGTINGTLSLTSDTPRYSVSTKFSSGSYITHPQLFTMYHATYSFWVKEPSFTTYGAIYSPTGSPGNGTTPWFSANTESSSVWTYFGGNSPNYTKGSGSLSTNTWYHCVYVWNNGVAQWYLNGVATGNSATYTGKTYIQNTTTGSLGDSYTGTSWNGTSFTGQLSDFRIYCTALSADDILSLYHTAAKVDNLGGLHTFEFQEKGPNKIYKTGITQGQEISEIDGMSNLKYDPNVYIEPDGSAWVRIFHHVNPTSNKFASGDTFTTGVYKDENRWFNFDLCNYTDKWEFIAAVTRTNTDTLERYRWVQSANPLSATFDQTKVANVTRITTGYNTSPLGGLYHVSGSSWLAANNGTNNNWFGATGCWTAWNGGIPGWKSTAAGDAVTTGTIDIYLRIDNITTVMPSIAKSTKNNIWVGHTLIEK